MTIYRKARHFLSRTPLRILLNQRRHRGLLPQDVFLASYPRSGNTWLRSLLYEVLTGKTPTFGDIDRPSSPVGHLGNHARSSVLLESGGRLIKTHEPFRGEYQRAIYLIRDVRDVVLSEFRYQKWSQIFAGDVHQFIAKFVRGKVNGYGLWPDHVTSWLDAPISRTDDLLVIKYEDFRRDSERILNDILKFIGVEAEEGLARTVLENNSIARMQHREKEEKTGIYKENTSEYRFVHKGQIGGWRETMTSEEVAALEQMSSQVLQELGYPMGDAA